MAKRIVLIPFSSQSSHFAPALDSSSILRSVLRSLVVNSATSYPDSPTRHLRRLAFETVARRVPGRYYEAMEIESRPSSTRIACGVHMTTTGYTAPAPPPANGIGQARIIRTRPHRPIHLPRTCSEKKGKGERHHPHTNAEHILLRVRSWSLRLRVRSQRPSSHTTPQHPAKYSVRACVWVGVHLSPGLPQLHRHLQQRPVAMNSSGEHALARSSLISSLPVFAWRILPLPAHSHQMTISSRHAARL
ncbi:hypothetical protein K438DRAFT_1995117 [Mycena galopus ATCC 62051]|nr:hypothetical protein K438DRAFT_1995117 [Mycena galopus ATCC 62051]